MIKNLTVILLISLCSIAFAQQTALTSQYLMNRLVVNPAYAGSLDYYSISSSYRKQWVGIDGAPSTQNVSFNGPIMKGKLGVGLLLFRDVIGVTRQNNITGNFAYKIKGRNKKLLSFGIAGTVIFANNEWNKIKTTSDNDNVFSSNTQKFTLPDFSAGIYYKTPKFHVGFSVPMFLNHKLKDDGSGYSIGNNFGDYNYLLEAGTNFKLTNKIILRPSFMSRYIPNASYQLDLNILADFNNVIGVGVSYRTEDAIVGLVQVRFTDQIIFGYSFDQSISELQTYNNGSHEVFLRYDFRYKVRSFDPRFF